MGLHAWPSGKKVHAPNPFFFFCTWIDDNIGLFIFLLKKQMMCYSLAYILNFREMNKKLG